MNTFLGKNEFCTIHLRGGDVHIDFCDLSTVDPYTNKWTIVTKGKNKYATAHMIVGGRCKTVYMHLLILGFPTGIVDHEDRNGLNNRRGNFRIGTHYQNFVNSGPRKRGKSRFKGVSWHKHAKKWRATIQAHGKWMQVGLFVSEEDAARAYDLAASQHHGRTAYLNRSEFAL